MRLPEGDGLRGLELTNMYASTRCSSLIFVNLFITVLV